MHEHHFSALKLLADCPASYVLREHAMGNVYLTRGTVAHKAVEEYVQGVRSQGRSSDPDLMEQCITKHVRGHLPPDELDYVLEILRSFASGFDASVPAGWVAHSERTLACLLRPSDDGVVEAAHVEDVEAYRNGTATIDPGSVLVVSTLDDLLWDEARTMVRVRDWKTNRAIKPASELAYDLQCRVYAVQAFALLGIENMKVGPLYLNGLREVTFEMGPEEIAQAVDELYTLCRRAESVVEPETTPGPACASCFVAHVCPETARVLDRLRVHSGPASLSPSEYPVMLRLVDDTTKALKAGTAETGPIKLASGAYIGYRTRERQKLRPGWQQILVDYGMHQDDVLALGSSQATIRKGLRAHPEWSKEVHTIMDAITELEAYTEFGVHGPGGE